MLNDTVLAAISEGLNLWQPLAGLALFLLAIAFLEEAIQAIAGDRFKTLLVNHTSSPLRGIFIGTIATAILQSSSLVSLLMLAFVGARILPMKNALAVVFGANLGTTATGWLVATIGFKLDLEGLALPLIAIGGLALTLAARQWRHYGKFTLALGLLLLGLRYMKGAVGDATELIDPQTLAELGPLQYLLFGAAFSAVIQSSSATMAIALSALDAGLINLGAAAAIAIGADLGTTSTVLLGAIHGTASKKRVALGHFLFNLVTDLVAFAVRTPLLFLLAPLNDDVLILVAFHSTFNLLGIGFFLPVVGRFSAFLERRFTSTRSNIGSFLGEVPTTVPDAAVQAIENETMVLAVRVIGQNRLALGTPFDQIAAGAAVGPVDLEPSFEGSYEHTKRLEGEILAYALELDRNALMEVEQKRLAALLEVCRGAVLSSKLCKDLLHDLATLGRLAPALCAEIRSSQQELDRKTSDVAVRINDASLKQILHLDEAADEEHARFHARIYHEIKEDSIDEIHASMLLNLNRALFNKNKTIITALALLSQTLKHSRAMPANAGSSVA